MVSRVGDRVSAARASDGPAPVPTGGFQPAAALVGQDRQRRVEVEVVLRSTICCLVHQHISGLRYKSPSPSRQVTSSTGAMCSGSRLLLHLRSTSGVSGRRSTARAHLPAAGKTRRSSVHAQDHLRYRLHAGGTAARKEWTVSEFTTRRLVPPASATMDGTRAKRSRWWSVAAVADSTAGFDVEVVPQARCRPGEFHGGCRRSGTAVEATALLLGVRAP